MEPKKFVETYYEHALESENKKGIKAEFILAQAALETGWGKHVPGNMFFGVKANPKLIPEKDRQLLTTTEIFNDNLQGYRFPEVISITQRADGRYKYVIKDWFRKYSSPEQSFSDHSDFFYNNKRYSEALKVKHDPYLFAQEIAKAGYATDPNYANTLNSIIRTIEKYVKI